MKILPCPNFVAGGNNDIFTTISGHVHIKCSQRNVLSITITSECNYVQTGSVSSNHSRSILFLGFVMEFAEFSDIHLGKTLIKYYWPTLAGIWVKRQLLNDSLEATGQRDTLLLAGNGVASQTVCNNPYISCLCPYFEASIDLKMLSYEPKKYLRDCC